MKFFFKNPDSQILKDNLVYSENSSKKNSQIKNVLINEQKNFCAYTEKYLDGIDSVEVEHFDSSIKYKDDYYNYYAVLRKPNLYKKDKKFKSASFFSSKFYQDKDELNSRIRYIKDEYIFEEVDPEDTEARDFIDFLGLNNHDLFSVRKNHCNRIKELFNLGNISSKENKIGYFNNHKTELSFITILEEELDLDLSLFYN